MLIAMSLLYFHVCRINFSLFFAWNQRDNITDGREYDRDARALILLLLVDRWIGVELSKDLNYFHPVGFGDTACLLVFEAPILARVRNALAMIERTLAHFVHLREQTSRKLLLTPGEAVA